MMIIFLTLIVFNDFAKDNPGPGSYEQSHLELNNDKNLISKFRN